MQGHGDILEKPLLYHQNQQRYTIFSKSHQLNSVGFTLKVTLLPKRQPFSGQGVRERGLLWCSQETQNLTADLPQTHHFKDKLIRLPVGGICGQKFSFYEHHCPSLLPASLSGLSPESPIVAFCRMPALRHHVTETCLSWQHVLLLDSERDLFKQTFTRLLCSLLLAALCWLTGRWAIVQSHFIGSRTCLFTHLFHACLISLFIVCWLIWSRIFYFPSECIILDHHPFLSSVFFLFFLHCSSALPVTLCLALQTESSWRNSTAEHISPSLLPPALNQGPPIPFLSLSPSSWLSASLPLSTQFLLDGESYSAVHRAALLTHFLLPACTCRRRQGEKHFFSVPLFSPP